MVSAYTVDYITFVYIIQLVTYHLSYFLSYFDSSQSSAFETVVIFIYKTHCIPCAFVVLIEHSSEYHLWCKKDIFDISIVISFGISFVILKKIFFIYYFYIICDIKKIFLIYHLTAYFSFHIHIFGVPCWTDVFCCIHTGLLFWLFPLLAVVNVLEWRCFLIICTQFAHWCHTFYVFSWLMYL